MTQYIDKDALVAEIEKLMYGFNLEADIASTGECFNEELADAKYQLCKLILSFIDTLEVKEVDLDFQMFAKEMDAVFALPSSETNNTEEEPLNWEYAIAKHFYELGLAQKGE